MIHTYFYDIISSIKKQEYNELYRAVEAHGGSYKWDWKSDDIPTIAVNITKDCYPNPTDVDILSVSIVDGMLKLEGVEKEWRYEVDFEPTDVFAGHLSYIIDCIPAIDSISDVTSKPNIKVLFGKAACEAFKSGEIQEFIESGEGYGYHEREFDTEVEKQAYIAGLCDLNGWNDYVILGEEEITQKSENNFG